MSDDPVCEQCGDAESICECGQVCDDCGNQLEDCECCFECGFPNCICDEEEE